MPAPAPAAEQPAMPAPPPQVHRLPSSESLPPQPVPFSTKSQHSHLGCPHQLPSTVLIPEGTPPYSALLPLPLRDPSWTEFSKSIAHEPLGVPTCEVSMGWECPDPTLRNTTAPSPAEVLVPPGSFSILEGHVLFTCSYSGSRPPCCDQHSCPELPLPSAIASPPLRPPLRRSLPSAVASPPPQPPLHHSFSGLLGTPWLLLSLGPWKIPGPAQHPHPGDVRMGPASILSPQSSEDSCGL